MLAIRPTLTLGQQGAEVADLHRALQLLGFDQIPAADLNERMFGPGTADQVRNAQHYMGLQSAAPGVVDALTAEALNQRLHASFVLNLVQGSVVGADGTPLAGSLVFATDRDNIGGAYLGYVDADASGRFHIFYDPKRYAVPDEGVRVVKERVDLILQVYSNGVLLMESAAFFDPAPDLSIDLQVPSGSTLALGTASECLVAGRVQREDGRPVADGLVRALHIDERGSVRLGEDRTDTDGRYTIRYATIPGRGSVRLRMEVTSPAGRLLRESDTRPAGTLEIIDLTVPNVDPASTTHRIDGRVVGEHGQPAENLVLRLYRRDFSGVDTRLAETITGDFGIYALTFDTGGKSATIEIRAAAAGEDREVALSEALQVSGERSVVNLAAPAELTPLAPEYSRLQESLTPVVGEMSELAGAREDGERKDLTVLTQATGWDARLIGLAAAAERLASDPGVGLSDAALYALFRAGLPSDKLQLANMSSDAIEPALTKAVEAGIADLSADDVSAVKAQFATFARETRLGLPVAGSQATYSELLEKAGISAAAQSKFASVFADHTGSGEELWQRAREAGLGDSQIKKLQLQGKIAFLTGNSAPMTAHLQNGPQLSDPVELVDKGFYQTEVWLAEINAAAGVPADEGAELSEEEAARLDAVIPPSYGGETLQARRRAYADDMARKVRISYPTHVVRSLIEHDDRDRFKLGAARIPVSTLLRNAESQGFKLGETPVEPFMRAHADVMEGIDLGAAESAKEGLKTLQRMYQITPSDEAMSVLMEGGFTSAYDVVSVPKEIFLERFTAALGSREWAEMVYRKAEQVNSITYNLFTIARKLESEPPVFGLTGRPEEREAVKNELIKHVPSMESLFGSTDYCECDHCRSVLSPAAYFVNLLQFIDPEAPTWNNLVAHWSSRHGGEDYGARYKKPYDALIERRPDLPHIPLTCENTNTALPYIDVVNEILEYYVAHGRLSEAAVRDTGSATTAELLAEPQHVIAAAYEMLGEARYPLTLPFDLWLETVRSFCDYFEIPLWRLQEVLRRTDDLYSPSHPYDRAAIFAEQLGLSPAEYALFTDPSPLDTWHELYGFASEEEAMTEAVDADTGQRIDLHSARSLSRRLGVTYKELVEIVRTGFVNPNLEPLAVLQKLGITIRDAFAYRERSGFYEANKDLLDQERSHLAPDERARFDALTEAEWQQLGELQAVHEALDAATRAYAPFGFDAGAWLDEALGEDAFSEILVLADPDAGADFDLTTLRFADGRSADGIAFLKINLFVRLQRKLGWTIEETDRALQAFIPAGTPFTEEHLDKQPLRTALVYLAHLKHLDEELRPGKQGRIKLLTLWADLPTTGRDSLYAQLFLRKSILQADAVFDHPLGRFLSEEGLAAMARARGDDADETFMRIEGHRLALQSALGLTAREIDLILSEEGLSASAPISLRNVSLLYRYGMFAKVLGMSVGDVIALKQLSGVNAMQPVGPDPLAVLEEDLPFSQTVRFVEIAALVKETGLKIDDLDYLLRHRFDPVGPNRPDRAAIHALIRGLVDGMHAFGSEHAVSTEPSAFSEEQLRQKLGLAMGPDVVERLMGMVNGTVEFTAGRAAVSEDDRLDADDYSREPSVRHLRYDETREIQHLTFQGVLFDQERMRLTERYPSSVFAELLDAVHVQARAFFEHNFLKQQLGRVSEAGFLDASDFDTLFAPLQTMQAIEAGDTADEVEEKTAENERIAGENETTIQERRKRIAASFLPVLRRRLIRQYVIQTLVAESGADPALVEALVTDSGLLAEVVDDDAREPILAAFTGAATRGIDGSFFATGDASGEPLLQLISEDLNTAVGMQSARFEGYFGVPATGAYRFFLGFDRAGAAGELRFEHLAEPILTGAAAEDGDVISEYVELKTGVLYRIRLDLLNLNGAGARLLVQSETLPRGPVSRLTLFPLSSLERAERAYVLVSKVLRLVSALGLTEREVRYLLSHADDFGGLDLSRIPTTESDDAQALFRQILRLAAYARLKRELAGGTDEIIGIFEGGSLERAVRLIAHVARRDEATVEAAARVLFDDPVAIANEESLGRLWEALKVVEIFGVPAEEAAKWATASTGPSAQRFEAARSMKEALKARFEPEAWQRVVRPIFDRMRKRRRDALAAYVMHTRGFARVEQLYEYFLIDPGMEPIVQTSRIRQAIASVQLFVQRCLLNLERQVPPSVINAKQWEWMKRYRVWEANRKIFLFPENWLEPEFRDDKTHLFGELEGTLLQGDVSADLVEDAFLNYLKKLEEIARLDMVGTYCEDHGDPEHNILHVIGRTYNTPARHFYRRYAGRVWTPWEPVTADIQGDHIVPLVWRDRLHLFWVTFRDEPQVPSASDGTLTKAKMTMGDHFVVEKAKSGVGAYTGGSGSKQEDKLTALTVSQVQSKVLAGTPSKTVLAQLHWSEYVNGTWSTRESPGDVASLWASVSLLFDPTSVFVHGSKLYENGIERGVKIHMSAPIDQALYIAGRNSTAVSVSREAPPPTPYNAGSPRVNRYHGSGSLKVTFTRRITTEKRKPPVKTTETLAILQKSGSFVLIPCSNAIMLGNAEIASLVTPLFLQDAFGQTFYVEPSLTERTIEEWQEWVTHIPAPDPGADGPDWWTDLPLKPLVPLPDRPLPISPDDPIWKLPITPESRYRVDPGADWLVNPSTALQFDDVLVGPAGRAGGGALLPAAMEERAGGMMEARAEPSALIGAREADPVMVERAGHLGLQVVGRSGLDAATRSNIARLDLVIQAGRFNR